MRVPSTDPLVAAIRRIAPTAVPGAFSVTEIQPVPRHPNVWKVELGNGSLLVAKHHVFAPLARGKPHDLLAVEQLAHARLFGAPVPRLYAADNDHDLVFFEWCGDHTLDDVCQDGVAEVYGSLAVEGFSRIQSVFHAQGDVFAPRTVPGCHRPDLRRTWRRATQPLIRDVPRLAERLSGPVAIHRIARFRKALSDLLENLDRAAPLPGPTDYHARNIVINPADRTLRFIEFSKIGWDWPERRLTQYTTSHGAGRPDGRTYSALTPALNTRYAALTTEYRAESETEIAALLDGHHFIFHLLAARSLLDALRNPHHPLLNSWRNPEARLEQLRRILTLSLSADPRTTELRSFFERRLNRPSRTGAAGLP